MARRPLLTALVVVGLIAAGVLAYGAGRWLAGASAEPAGTELENPPRLDEPLLGADGRARTLAQLAAEGGDAVLLVFFGFTRCPDVCPATLSRVAAAYRATGEPDDVGVAMVTVDPEHDTPEATQRYVEGFHPDFTGLSGDSGAIARAARTFYIGVRDAPDGLIAHTDVVAVVDADGRMRRIYGQADLGALERDLPKLARAY